MAELQQTQPFLNGIHVMQVVSWAVGDHRTRHMVAAYSRVDLTFLGDSCLCRRGRGPGTGHGGDQAPGPLTRKGGTPAMGCAYTAPVRIRTCLACCYRFNVAGDERGPAEAVIYSALHRFAQAQLTVPSARAQEGDTQEARGTPGR
jgi:hypothetical protein